MAVAHDADSNAKLAPASTSLTWSHTCTGANGLLVVGLSWTLTSATMSTITHAGNAPTGTTGLFDATSSYHTQIWWWVNPTTGAQNIIATPSSSLTMYGGGCSFTGVDQLRPVATIDTTKLAGLSFGTVSTSVNPSNGNMGIFANTGLATQTSTIAAVAPAAQAFNQFDVTDNRTGFGEWLIIAGAKYKTTMSQLISGSTNRNWATQIITINPVDGTLVAPTTFNKFQSASVGDGMSAGERIR